jgi:hypothetical protein
VTGSTKTNTEMISTEINFKDFKSFNDFIQKKNKIKKFYVRLIICSILSVSLVFFLRYSIPLFIKDIWILVTPCLIFFLAFTLGVFFEKFIMENALKQFVKSNPKILGKFQITFSDSFVEVKSENAKTEYVYNSFFKSRRNQRTLFYFCFFKFSDNYS